MWEFTALGTSWDITLPASAVPEGLRVAVTTELARIDALWSRFRGDSLVATMATTAGRYPIPASDQPMIDLHRQLYEVSGAKVTPLVGQTLDDAGYDGNYSLRPAPQIASVPSWEDVFARWDQEFDLIVPALIDVGATGKGFAVDRVAELVVAHGFDEFLVNGSGDIKAGTQAHRIALEHPTDPTKAIGTVMIERNAICGSASNRRAWANWHHIVDPTTATPTRNVLATWAIADDAMVADGLSTALFFCSPLTLQRHYDFDYVVVHSSGAVAHSQPRDLELFL